MTIAGAILIAMGVYLIDKHKLWKLGLEVLWVFAWLGLTVWLAHKAWRWWNPSPESLAQIGSVLELAGVVVVITVLHRYRRLGVVMRGLVGLSVLSFFVWVAYVVAQISPGLLVAILLMSSALVYEWRRERRRGVKKATGDARIST